MKIFLSLALVFSLPMLGFSQDFVGKWKMMVPAQDGQMMPIHSTVKADGTYQLDWGGDGQVEINGKYELEGDKVTLWDLNADCSAKGVYRWKIEGKTMTMTRIEDPCVNRGGPEGVMVMTRL